MEVQLSKEEKKILVECLDMTIRHANRNITACGRGYDGMDGADREKINKWKSVILDIENQKKQTEKYGVESWDAHDYTRIWGTLDRRTSRSKEGSVLRKLREKLSCEL